jgi:hypothetical protein
MVRHSAKKGKRKRDGVQNVQQERKRRTPAPQLTQEDEDEDAGIVQDFEIETVELLEVHDEGEGDEVEESEAGEEVDGGAEVDNDDDPDDSNDDDIDIEPESIQKENEDGEE